MQSNDQHGHKRPARDDAPHAKQPIDPLVCPRGHHAISLSARRFSCQTCRNQQRPDCTWAKTELVDLREETPPLAEDTALDTRGDSSA